MIRKMAVPNSDLVRVFFELPSCIWADRIYVVGDFNQWHESSTPLQHERDGVWRAVVDLPQGYSYEFRYLIDGEWTSDFHADGFAQNKFGISNSIVHTSLPVSPIFNSEHHGAASRVKERVSLRTVLTHDSYRPSPIIYPAKREPMTA
jgi:hypothetical protein